MGPAGTTIQRELKLDDVAMGYVLGGFFLGYTWFQVPAGWLGDRLGARASLAIMGGLWTVSMVATASAHSYEVLIWSRVAQGVAQAGLFAVTIKALADWFPVSRRGMTSSVITACMSVGAVLASGLTVRLSAPFGWRGTFLGYAAITAVWSVAFAVWFRDTPEKHRGANRAEVALIRGKVEIDAAKYVHVQSKPRKTTRAALLGMAGSLGMWALCVTSFFRAFGYALFITWFPAYLEKGHGVGMAGAGDLTVMPLVGVVLGCFVGGWLVDAILARTGSKRLSRSGVAAAALGLCSAATLAAILARQPSAVVGVISVGSFFSGLAAPATWAATADLCGDHAAVGFAVMNMAGNLGAIACPVVLGYLIDHLVRAGGDWNWVLYLFAADYLAAALCWLALDPSRPAVPAAAL